MQIIEGIIKSLGSANSVVVVVDRLFHHHKYHKTVMRTTSIAAHNETGDLKIGDRVQLVKSKPYSKTKHFKVLKKT